MNLNLKCNVEVILSNVIRVIISSHTVILRVVISDPVIVELSNR